MLCYQFDAVVFGSATGLVCFIYLSLLKKTAVIISSIVQICHKSGRGEELFYMQKKMSRSR